MVDYKNDASSSPSLHGMLFHVTILLSCFDYRVGQVTLANVHFYKIITGLFICVPEYVLAAFFNRGCVVRSVYAQLYYSGSLETNDTYRTLPCIMHTFAQILRKNLGCALYMGIIILCIMHTKMWMHIIHGKVWYFGSAIQSVLLFLILTRGYVYWFLEREERRQGKRERERVEREKETDRERETSMDQSPLHIPWLGNTQLRYVPWWPGLNPQLSGVKDDAPTNWATWPGLSLLF